LLSLKNNGLTKFSLNFWLLNYGRLIPQKKIEHPKIKRSIFALTMGLKFARNPTPESL